MTYTPRSVGWPMACGLCMNYDHGLWPVTYVRPMTMAYVWHVTYGL